MYGYHKCRTSYSGTDICEASLDYYYSYDVSAEDGETDREGSDYDPCDVDLNRVPVILDEDYT